MCAADKCPKMPEEAETEDENDWWECLRAPEQGLMSVAYTGHEMVGKLRAPPR